MKSFLEEYGFAILAAIVVILLIAMCSPVGNVIKTQVLNTVERFAGTADKKLASANDDEMSANILGGTLYVTSPSTTDQYTVVLHGTKVGSPYTITLGVPTDGAEKTVKSWNLDVSEFDAGSTYYAAVTNVGTGAVFTSNIVTKTDAATGESGGPTISVSKGDTLTLGAYQYLIMDVQDNEALVVMKASKTNAKFHVESNAYSSSNLKSLMDGYYNDSENALGVAKDAIVAKTITVGTYQYNSSTPRGDYFAKGQYAYNGDLNNKKDYYITSLDSTTLANQYVYALDVQDVVNYLGKDNLTPENITDTFGLTLGGLNQRDFIWLRSARAGSSSSVWRIEGRFGNLTVNGADSVVAVRPAFVLDLSKLG